MDTHQSTEAHPLILAVLLLGGAGSILAAPLAATATGWPASLWVVAAAAIWAPSPIGIPNVLCARWTDPAAEKSSGTPLAGWLGAAAQQPAVIAAALTGWLITAAALATTL